MTTTTDPRVMALKQVSALSGDDPHPVLCDGAPVAGAAGAWIPAIGEESGEGGWKGGGVLVAGLEGDDRVSVKVSNHQGEAPWWAHLSPNRAEELAHLLLIAAARARRNA